MGVYLEYFYFILLLWLLQAATSQEPGKSRCNETCGGVTIPSPFGIKRGCYNNSWFRVTCNETANGPKPLISRINLELIDLFLSDGDTVTVGVNNPVTYLNCGGKGNNGTTTAPASVNLQGSPFFFPGGKMNIFGSVGCGNWAAITSYNQTNYIAGCQQQRCGDLTSNIGVNCYAEISEDLVSYATTMTEITDHGKLEQGSRCTAAFIFSLDSWVSVDDYPTRISIDTTHVPAVLKWNPVEFDLEG
ncbi:hypothetical protein PTKIN_Ptkin09bG0246300 [Pterospermum kingtungense]